MAERVYSTTDLADLFGTSRQTVNSWIDNDYFPNVQKVGRSYAVPASDIKTFVKSKIEELEEEIANLEGILGKVE